MASRLLFEPKEAAKRMQVTLYFADEDRCLVRLVDGKVRRRKGYRENL